MAQANPQRPSIWDRIGQIPGLLNTPFPPGYGKDPFSLGTGVPGMNSMNWMAGLGGVDPLTGLSSDGILDLPAGADLSIINPAVQPSTPAPDLNALMQGLMGGSSLGTDTILGPAVGGASVPSAPKHVPLPPPSTVRPDLPEAPTIPLPDYSKSDAAFEAGRPREVGRPVGLTPEEQKKLMMGDVLQGLAGGFFQADPDASLGEKILAAGIGSIGGMGAGKTREITTKKDEAEQLRQWEMQQENAQRSYQLQLAGYNSDQANAIAEIQGRNAQMEYQSALEQVKADLEYDRDQWRYGIESARDENAARSEAAQWGYYQAREENEAARANATEILKIENGVAFVTLTDKNGNRVLRKEPVYSGFEQALGLLGGGTTGAIGLLQSTQGNPLMASQALGALLYARGGSAAYSDLLGPDLYEKLQEMVETQMGASNTNTLTQYGAEGNQQALAQRNQIERYFLAKELMADPALLKRALEILGGQ
jgi:hypothetical protein